MRVLYVLRYYPTLTETFVYREVSALQARGVEVDAVAWGSRADGALADQLPTWSVTRPPRGLGALALARPLRRLGSSRGRAAMRATSNSRLKDRLRTLWLADVATGYDRVHTHFAGEAAEWACAAAAVAGVPFSVTAHAVDLWKPRAATGAVLRAARPAIAVCEDGRREIARAFGVHATIVRVGVDTDVPLAMPRAGGPMRIVAVGREVPKKGLDRLRAASQRATFAHELRIASSLRPSEVPAFLASADLFVLPCRIAPDGDRDGVPVAILEAMAAGLPVIATDVGGIAEVVDDSVGWLVPADDDAALDRALAHAAADVDARRIRGAAGRARIVARHTIAAQADALRRAWA